MGRYSPDARRQCLGDLFSFLVEQGFADGFAGAAVPAGGVGKVTFDTVKMDMNPGAGRVVGGLGIGGAPFVGGAP